MGLRNDYRVSTIIVLCKDCGQDVGLYPARHECSNVKRPHLPTLCSTTNTQWDIPDLIKSGPISATVKRQASDSSIESGKWNFFRSSTTVKNDENYYATLKNSSSCNDIKDLKSGKKLWGKVKENEKWKELIADKKKEEDVKQSGKLWSRIMQVTMSNPLEEVGPESDDEDWEGETHISRILREYYESKNKPLPSWLFEQDDSTQIKRSSTARGRRLWQQDNNLTSAREREIEALRNSTIPRTQSEHIINIQKDEDTCGFVSPRRTNTTRSPVKSYLVNNIPSSVRSQNYF